MTRFGSGLNAIEAVARAIVVRVRTADSLKHSPDHVSCDSRNHTSRHLPCITTYLASHRSRNNGEGYHASEECERHAPHMAHDRICAEGAAGCADAYWRLCARKARE